jgi:alkylhydroperoxidase family enzyme
VRYDRLIEELRSATLDGPGELAPEVRRAAASGGPLSSDLAAWAAKVRERAYATTDDEVDELLRAGHSEDVIFEVTVAAALGAGLERFDAGVRALR